MRLFDTYTQTVREFVPAGQPVRLYVCGITPYDTTHLGHAFTYVFFDTLIRYLEWLGNSVRYVQNVTDVDDDILRRARERGLPWDELGREETRRYAEDMAALNVRPPTVYPRASRETAKMTAIGERLLKKGLAYAVEGNLYFHVKADPDFGTLSHLTPEEMLPIANERGNDPNDPCKSDPLDFVLWQRSRSGEPVWESPFGPGRPGWHIECSAMALKYLGETIDIHGGGADLVFPHHEAELAQAECYTGKRPFVRFWVHVGMVRLDGEKMSKSLGNLVMVRDLLRTHTANAIRLNLLSHHYRESWSYSAAALREMEGLAAQLANALRRPESSQTGRELDIVSVHHRFRAAMDDDLQTPTAVALLRTAASEIASASAQGLQIGGAQQALAELMKVLGLLVPEPAGAREATPAIWEGWQHLLGPRRDHP